MRTVSTSRDRPVLTRADLEAHDPRAADHGEERRYLCPLPACAGHQIGARHRSLALNVASGLWTCHRCGAGGRLREHWPSEPSRRRRSVARRSLVLTSARASSRPSAESGADTTAVARVRALYDAGLPLPDTRGAEYLAARGIDAGAAAGAGVRFLADFFGRPAVVFPLADRAGAPVAVNGRYVDGRTDPKARTAGRKALGAFATARAWESEPLAICEAPIDALTLAVCGVPAVALCGTSGPAWLAAACAFRRVALALDADAAGDAAATNLTTVLRSLGARVERWRPIGAKDWNAILAEHGLPALRAALCAWTRDGHATATGWLREDPSPEEPVSAVSAAVPNTWRWRTP